ncbi:mCG145840, partial [Mus musculus]
VPAGDSSDGNHLFLVFARFGFPQSFSPFSFEMKPALLAKVRSKRTLTVHTDLFFLRASWYHLYDTNLWTRADGTGGARFGPF